MVGVSLYVERVAELLLSKFNGLYGTKIRAYESIVTRKTQEQEQHANRVFSAVHNSFVFSDHLCDTLYVRHTPL